MWVWTHPDCLMIAAPQPHAFDGRNLDRGIEIDPHAVEPGRHRISPAVHEPRPAEVRTVDRQRRRYSWPPGGKGTLPDTRLHEVEEAARYVIVQAGDCSRCPQGRRGLW